MLSPSVEQKVADEANVCFCDVMQAVEVALDWTDLTYTVKVLKTMTITCCIMQNKMTMHCCIHRCSRGCRIMVALAKDDHPSSQL